MEKGCYGIQQKALFPLIRVTIHSDSGKGLLQGLPKYNGIEPFKVTIHSDSGKGLLQRTAFIAPNLLIVTIHSDSGKGLLLKTIIIFFMKINVTIHSDSGKGLLPQEFVHPNGNKEMSHNPF